MKIGLMADAHGNWRALRVAIDQMAPTVDRFLFAGDSFSDHRFCNDSVAGLRSVDASCIAGNHEISFLSAAGSRARQAARMTPQNLDFVAALPRRIGVELDGVRILMVHASPWSPYDDYLGETDARWARLEGAPIDVLVTGHTHWPFVRRAGGVRVVNPGSVGRSDCPVTGDDISWAVLDTSSGEVEFFRHPNPELPTS